MTNTEDQDGRLTPESDRKGPRPATGATISIPPRSLPARRPARAFPTPFGPTTLHARLALLRPVPLRAGTHPRNDDK
jgi:hypothetical protein